MARGQKGTKVPKSPGIIGLNEFSIRRIGLYIKLYLIVYLLVPTRLLL